MASKDYIIERDGWDVRKNMPTWKVVRVSTGKTIKSGLSAREAHELYGSLR